MEIILTLELADWYSYLTHIQKEIPKKNKSWATGYIFNVILWFLLIAVVMVLFQVSDMVHWPTAGVVTVFFTVFILIYFFSSYRFRKASAPNSDGVFLGEHKFIFSEDGIRSIGKGYEGLHSWSLVQRVERKNGLILVFIDTASAHIFPESKLENPEEFHSYLVENVVLSV